MANNKFKIEQVRVRGGWFTVFIFVLFAFLSVFYLDDLVEYGNKELYGEQYCHRYDYYMDNINKEFDHQCIARCWRLYGCYYNATGTKYDCDCNGIDISVDNYMDGELIGRYIQEQQEQGNIMEHR